MILDSNGEKISKTKVAKAAIFMSEDCELWRLIKPCNVPEWLTDRDVMGYMMDGEIMCGNESGPYYKAEKVH